jgi:hypothetical protein
MWFNSTGIAASSTSHDCRTLLTDPSRVEPQRRQRAPKAIGPAPYLAIRVPVTRTEHALRTSPLGSLRARQNGTYGAP